MKEAQAWPALRVMAHGWEFPAWVNAFYPEDLPADWRLAYYANEFRGILVPDACWRAAAPAALESWFGDLAEPFGVYLEWRSGMPAERVDLIRRVLPDGLLKGVLAAEGVSVPADLPAWRIDGTGARTCWRPGRSQADGLGMLKVELGDEPSPRELRALLEGFLAANLGQAQATLVVTGETPSFRAMRDLEVMGCLLGA